MLESDTPHEGQSVMINANLKNIADVAIFHDRYVDGINWLWVIQNF